MAVCCMGLIKQLGTNSSVRKSKGKIQTFTAAAFSNFQNVLSLNWTANKSHHSHQVKISPYITKLLPKTRRAGKSQLAKVVTFHWKEGFCFQNANSDNFTWYFLLKNYLSIFLEGTNGTEKLTFDQQGKINQSRQQYGSRWCQWSSTRMSQVTILLTRENLWVKTCWASVSSIEIRSTRAQTPTQTRS